MNDDVAERRKNAYNRTERDMLEISERCGRRLDGMTAEKFKTADVATRQFHTARNQAHMTLGLLYAGAFTDAMDAGAMATRIFDQAILKEARPYVERGISYAKSQAKRASNPRTPPEIAAIIEKLAKRDETIKALWAAFYGDLDVEGLHPVEGIKDESLAIWYETDAGRASMTIGTFRNRIGRARN